MAIKHVSKYYRQGIEHGYRDGMKTVAATKSKVGDLVPVRQLGRRYQFVSDSQDVEAIEQYIPRKYRGEFVAFYTLAKDGDFLEVWGVNRIAPSLDTIAERVL